MDAAQSRRNALGRLVAHENNASDLLAFLFEMDPKPMVGLLSLEDSHHTCRREAQAQGAKKGRLDLVVRRQADGMAVAVLEMKGASDLHGDQLDRYNSWAKRTNPTPKQFYCTLNGDGVAPPAPWQPLRACLETPAPAGNSASGRRDVRDRRVVPRVVTAREVRGSS